MGGATLKVGGAKKIARALMHGMQRSCKEKTLSILATDRWPPCSCAAYINGEKSPNPPPPFLSFPSSAIPLLLPPASSPL